MKCCCRFTDSDWWLCRTLEWPQCLSKLATHLHIPRVWRHIQLEWSQLVNVLLLLNPWSQRYMQTCLYEFMLLYIK